MEGPRWWSLSQRRFSGGLSFTMCEEMVLEAAVNARADALATFNVRDFGTVPARFGSEVLRPREAVRRSWFRHIETGSGRELCSQKRAPAY